MSTNIATVLSYFQSFSDPAKLSSLLIWLVVGLLLIFCAQRVYVVWEAQNRSIDKLSEENNDQRKQIAALHQAIFGGANTHNSLARHRMLVRSLHEVIPLLRNRNSVVSMLVATDEYLRNVQAAAHEATLCEYDDLTRGSDVTAGFGYQETYEELQHAVVNGWPNNLAETYALDRAILRAAEGIISEAIPGSDPMWTKAAAELRLAPAMPALGIGSLVHYPPKAVEAARVTLKSANEAIAMRESDAGVSGVKPTQSDEARRESIREQYRPDYGEGFAGV